MGGMERRIGAEEAEVAVGHGHDKAKLEEQEADQDLAAGVGTGDELSGAATTVLPKRSRAKTEGKKRSKKIGAIASRSVPNSPRMDSPMVERSSTSRSRGEGAGVVGGEGGAGGAGGEQAPRRRAAAKTPSNKSTSDTSSAEEICFRVEFVQGAGHNGVLSLQPRQYACFRLRCWALFPTPGATAEEVLVKVQSAQFESFVPHNGIQFLLTTEEYGLLRLRAHLVVKKDDLVLMPSTISHDTSPERTMKKRVEDHSLTVIENPLFGKSSTTVRRISSETGVQTLAIPGAITAPSRPLEIHSVSCSACSTHRPCPQSKYQGISIASAEKGEKGGEILCYLRVMAPPPAECKGWMPFAPSAAGRAIASLPPAEAEELHDKILAGIHESSPESTPPETYQVIVSVSSSARLVGDSMIVRLSSTKWCLSPPLEVISGIAPFFNLTSAMHQLIGLLGAGASPCLRAAVLEVQSRAQGFGDSGSGWLKTASDLDAELRGLVRQHQSGLDLKRLMRMKNSFGATVLHNACALGFPMLISFLLEETEKRVGKGTVSAGVNAADLNGRTPLHVAALAGSKECVVTLLSFSAVSNKRDVNGLIPLAYARQSGNGSLVRLLRSWSQMKDTKWMLASLSVEKEKLVQTLEETQSKLATERNTVRKMREKSEARQVSSPNSEPAKTMRNPLFGMSAKTVLNSPPPKKGELKVVNGQTVFTSSPSPEKPKNKEEGLLMSGADSASSVSSKVAKGRQRGSGRAVARKKEHDLRVMVERERLIRDMANTRLQELIEKLRSTPDHERRLVEQLQEISFILDGSAGSAARSSSTPTKQKGLPSGFKERLKVRELANESPEKKALRPSPRRGDTCDSSRDRFDTKAPKERMARSKSEKLRKMDDGDTIVQSEPLSTEAVRRRTSLGDSLSTNKLKDAIQSSEETTKSMKLDSKRQRKEEKKEKERKEKERKKLEKERKKEEKERERLREKAEKEKAKERAARKALDDKETAEESATDITEGSDAYSRVPTPLQEESVTESMIAESESEASLSAPQTCDDTSGEASASYVDRSDYLHSPSPKKSRKARRGKKSDTASPKSPRKKRRSMTPIRRLSGVEGDSTGDESPRAPSRSVSDTLETVGGCDSPSMSRPDRRTRKKMKNSAHAKEGGSSSPRRGPVGSTMDVLAGTPLARTRGFFKSSLVLSSPRTLARKRKRSPQVEPTKDGDAGSLVVHPRELKRSNSEPRMSSWEHRGLIPAAVVGAVPQPARSLQNFRRSYSEMMKVKLTADRVKRDQTKHYVALENEYLHHYVKFPGPDSVNSTAVARELAINDYLNFSGAVGLVAFKGESVSACAKSFVVDWLVDQNQDMYMLDTFLITFRRFLEPCEVLAAIVRKWEEIPPWSKKPDPHRQKRTLFVLRHWIDQYYHVDFANDPELTEQLYAFLEGPVARAGHQGTTAALMKAIAMSLEVIREQQAHTDNALKAFQTNMSERVEFLDLTPEDVARQLTLMEAELFQDVEPVWFMAPDKKQNKSLVNRFNTVSRWVSTEIVLEPNPRKRASVVRQFIRVAAMCLELNNFNGVLEIISGLNNAMVQRLKKTWKAIPSKLLAKFEELETLMDSRRNFGAYRKRLKEATPPLLPYFGIFLRDLSFADLGNDDAIPHIVPIHARPSAGAAKQGEDQRTKDKLVNFTKLYLLHEVAGEMNRCKMRCQYTIAVNHRIRNYLGNLIVLNDMALEQHSLLCEPRAFEL